MADSNYDKKHESAFKVLGVPLIIILLILFLIGYGFYALYIYTQENKEVVEVTKEELTEGIEAEIEESEEELTLDQFLDELADLDGVRSVYYIPEEEAIEKKLASKGKSYVRVYVDSWIDVNRSFDKFYETNKGNNEYTNMIAKLRVDFKDYADFNISDFDTIDVHFPPCTPDDFKLKEEDIAHLNESKGVMPLPENQVWCRPAEGYNTQYNEMEVYRNEDLGISFSYPSNFKIDIKNATDSTGAPIDFWHRIELTDPNIPGNPKFLIEVNADGYGPLFAERTYTGEDRNGKFKYIDVVNELNEYSLGSKGYMIRLKGFKSTNGNWYSAMVTYDETVFWAHYDLLFRKIIESMSFH